MRLRPIVFLYLLTTGCGKSEPVAPPAPSPTTTGENIMVYKLDGKLQVYKGKTNTVTAGGVFCSVVRMTTDSSIYIFGAADVSSQFYDGQITIELYTVDVEAGKEYPLSGKSASAKPEDYGEYDGSGFTGDEYTSRPNSGYVRFTRFDDEVLAGHFAFTVFNSDNGKKEITEGYFDIRQQN